MDVGHSENLSKMTSNHPVKSLVCYRPYPGACKLRNCYICTIIIFI